MNLKKEITIGIDIGGTKIIFALLRGKNIFKTEKVPTPKSKEEIIKLLVEKIVESKARRAGIGLPGILNEKRDLVLNPPNLRALVNCPLAKIVEKQTGVKTKMENDANCFTLAEALLGAGRGAKTVFGITLGTGVGGGIVIDGRIYKGAFGSAGEAGHMTINFDGPKCVCRNFGCLEEYASERLFKKIGRDYNKYGEYLGIGLSNVINLLDPEVIVIGGGIGNHYQSFIKTAKKEIEKRVISPLSKKNVKIKKAALGELGGAVGAGLLTHG